MVYIIAYFLIAASPTYAYLDPGTGSMAVQIVAATIFGTLFFLKSCWRKAVHLAKLLFGFRKQ